MPTLFCFPFLAYLLHVQMHHRLPIATETSNFCAEPVCFYGIVYFCWWKLKSIDSLWSGTPKMAFDNECGDSSEWHSVILFRMHYGCQQTANARVSSNFKTLQIACANTQWTFCRFPCLRTSAPKPMCFSNADNTYTYTHAFLICECSLLPSLASSVCSHTSCCPFLSAVKLRICCAKARNSDVSEMRLVYRFIRLLRCT